MSTSRDGLSVVAAPNTAYPATSMAGFLDSYCDCPRSSTSHVMHSQPAGWPVLQLQSRIKWRRSPQNRSREHLGLKSDNAVFMPWTRMVMNRMVISHGSYLEVVVSKW